MRLVSNKKEQYVGINLMNRFKSSTIHIDQLLYTFKRISRKSEYCRLPHVSVSTAFWTVDTGVPETLTYLKGYEKNIQSTSLSIKVRYNVEESSRIEEI